MSFSTKASTALRGLLNGSIPVTRLPRLALGAVRTLRSDFGRWRRHRRQAGPGLAEDLQHRHERAVFDWIGADPARGAARFVLYADIELNIVDGSSVWLSSMASVLCANGVCILVSRSGVRSDIVLANVAHRENLIVLEPGALGLGEVVLAPEEAIGVVRALDALVPHVARVVVRGLEAAHLLLGTRQFRERSVVYLTDFYSHTPEGARSTPEQARMVAVCAIQADTVLVQTERIEARLRETANADFKTIGFPPVVPDVAVPRRESVKRGGVSIGYAGKIAPDWGIEDLLDLVEAMRAEGQAVDLEIVANKVSRGAGATTAKRMEAMGIVRHTDFERARAMALMAEMDFVWCWRPASFEEETLELSTKLVEGVASGWRCICYPSDTNIALLGDDYPFFVRTVDEARRHLLDRPRDLPAGLSARVHDAHSLSGVTGRFRRGVLERPQAKTPLRIVFAGHDMKFIDPYVSSLKARGHAVLRDRWRWGEPADLERTRALARSAEVIFCEWGLANAVWHAANALPGQRVFVRVHLQEIDVRARRFGAALDIARVEKIIFVQEEVRAEALRLFGWPDDKTVVVPNFVLEDEYRAPLADRRSGLVLGMVGIVPQRKRLDRAIDLLETLRAAGHEARLMVKGPRPETIDFMRAPGRAAELQYYRDLLTGAWIETGEMLTGSTAGMVAPSRGRGSKREELRKLCEQVGSPPHGGVDRNGAWDLEAEFDEVAPSRGRGSKLFRAPSPFVGANVAPSRGRGSKRSFR